MSSPSAHSRLMHMAAPRAPRPESGDSRCHRAQCSRPSQGFSRKGLLRPLYLAPPLPLSKVSGKRPHSELPVGVEPSACPVFSKSLPSLSLQKALSYILFYLISKWS